ncbi:MAG: hypothetical protein HRT89_18815 [Lentisphaeria bacterium]|nr:hypothetical protein [Lentisphaeria bacterium]
MKTPDRDYHERNSLNKEQYEFRVKSNYFILLGFILILFALSISQVSFLLLVNATVFSMFILATHFMRDLLTIDHTGLSFLKNYQNSGTRVVFKESYFEISWEQIKSVAYGENELVLYDGHSSHSIAMDKFSETDQIKIKAVLKSFFVNP